MVVSRKELHKPTVSQLTRLLAQVLFFIVFELDLKSLMTCSLSEMDH